MRVNLLANHFILRAEEFWMGYVTHSERERERERERKEKNLFFLSIEMGSKMEWKKNYPPKQVFLNVNGLFDSRYKKCHLFLWPFSTTSKRISFALTLRHRYFVPKSQKETKLFFKMILRIKENNFTIDILTQAINQCEKMLLKPSWNKPFTHAFSEPAGLNQGCFW